MTCMIVFHCFLSRLTSVIIIELHRSGPKALEDNCAETRTQLDLQQS